MEKLEQMTEFSVVTVQLSPLIALSEQGLAWELVVRFKDGRQETFLASKMAVYSAANQSVALLDDERYKNKLVAILPYKAEQLNLARAVVISHDHIWCATLTGNDLGYCASLDEEDFDWQIKGNPVVPFVESAQAGGAFSVTQLRLLYEKAKAAGLIREENFGHNEQYLRIIENSQSPWPHVVRIIMASGTSMLVFSLASSPLAGAIAAALSGGVQTVQTAISVLSTRDINHPEYMHGFARNVTVAQKMLLLLTLQQQQEARITALQHQVEVLQRSKE